MAGVLGNRAGRVVGLLQGARARADSFAQQTELQQLHNELKSGLRELEAVKSEMAVAMSSRGMRSIGGPTAASRTVLSSKPTQQVSQQMSPIQAATTPVPNSSVAAFATPSIPDFAKTIDPGRISTPSPTSASRALAPKSQTIGAVAEDEWDKQGIGFRSRAERGVGLGYSEEDANNPLNSGSSILANIYKQNLIFDQYDHVVSEQDAILQSKIDNVHAKQKQDKENQKKES